MSDTRTQSHEAMQQPGAAAPAAGGAPAQRPYRGHPRSPGLACVLSLMPGLGQVYVGYAARGFLHIVVAGALIAFLSTEAVPALIPLAGLFLAFFWLYSIVDAGRRAAWYNHLLAGGEAIDMPKDIAGPGLRGSIAGGVLLIVLGVVLLLNTHFGISLEWLREWWPVAPIAFGVYLVVRALRERRATAEGPR